MTPPSSINDRLFAALTALIVLAPLPLACNRPWSWSLLCLCTALLTLAWAAGRLSGYNRPGLPLARLTVPAALFAVALTWGLIQALPSPFPALAHPVWAEASLALDRPLAGHISPDPDLSMHALMRLLAYGLIFLLATQLARRSHRATLGLKAVALSSLGYCAYALLPHLMGHEFILWLPKWAYIGDATGTFVGRAAFGAFAGIGVLACLSMAIATGAGQRPVVDTRERVEQLLAGTAPWMAGACLPWFALMASHSRGAFLATALGTLTLVVSAVAGRLLRLRHGLMLLALASVAAAVVVAAEGGATLGRMVGEGDWQGDRPNLLRLTWQAIGNAPLLGHGLGAFEAAFGPYRDTTLPRAVIYDFAHNTWAEVIMDLGWPAGICLLAAATMPVLACCAGLLRRRHNQIFPAMAVATAILVGSQSVVDFVAQIPALAALFAYVLGIGYAQAWPAER